jgi:3-hydroxyisobutyrate dehydrogenase
MKKVSFVGVGRMGANMARRLKDQGYQIAGIYDVRTESARDLAAEIGGQACDSLAETARLGEVIITVVTDEPAMRGIFGLRGESDHLLENAAGKIFVNCATVSPQVHLDVEKAAKAHGAHTLEACMASSITQARQGTLYLMVAGEVAVFQEMEPLLKTMSSSLRHVGKTGEAAKVKALVNMVMNINTAGLAEGLGLGDALGLDLTMLREVFSQTGANSRVLETDGEDMQNRDHACFFSAAHAAKDSGIALTLGQAAGLDLPLAAATKKQYDRMVDAGLGELDKSGIAELTFKGRGA